LEEGRTQEVSLILKQFKLPNGASNFPELFNIPSHERLPALAQLDFTRLNLLLIRELTLCFESMNFRRGMNEGQILALADLIIETSMEDNLALEDVLLFLQNMLKGKYELSYESLDIPKFMKVFEIYRQERYEAIQEFRYNRHLEYKALGNPERKKSSDPLDIHLMEMSTKIQILKDELREQKDINKRLKEDF